MFTGLHFNCTFAMHPRPDPETDQYIIDFTKKKAIWLSRSNFWNYVRWIVGTASVALSALSAAKTLPEPYQTTVALLTTITIGFLGFANPQKMSIRNLRGYLLLDPALRDYYMGKIDADALRAIHLQAEEAVHGEEGSKPD